MKTDTSGLKDFSSLNGELVSYDVPLLVYFDIGRVCSCSVMCTDTCRKYAVGAVNVNKVLNVLAEGGVRRVIFKGDYFYRQEGIFELSIYADGLGIESWFYVNGNIVRFLDNGSEGGSRAIEFRSEIFTDKRAEFLGTDRCGAGKLSCYINSCGSVSPCPVIPFRGGSVEEDDFLNIWKYDPLMNRFRFRSDPPPICEGCKLYV